MKKELSTTERVEEAVELLTEAYRELTEFIGNNNWRVQSAISLIAEELIGAADYRDGREEAIRDYENAECYHDLSERFAVWRVSIAFDEGYSDGFSQCDEG